MSGFCKRPLVRKGTESDHLFLRTRGNNLLIEDQTVSPGHGWHVAEIFRDRFPNVRVLYASGYSIAPRRDVAGSEFFNKPYRVEDILEACKR